MEIIGSGTHERPASPASAASCFGLAINRSSSRAQLPGTHERPASPASAANCFGLAINRSSSRDQLGNTWAWHTRTASITSISCEMLWPRNQQVIITRSAWKHLGLAHTNGQHHQHQLRIALAPQSTGHHHEISLETLGLGTHERPASPASAANCFWPRNQQVIITRSAWKHLGLAHTNGQHHQHQLRNCFGPAINRSAS